MEEQIRAYQKALKSNPLDIPAFTALEELYLGTDRWENLAELYKQRLEHLADPAERLPLLLKSAGVAHHRLADLGRAEQLYNDVLSLDPSNRAALEGLVEIYRKRNDWRQLALTLEQLALLSADAVERADLFEQLALLYSDRLNRRDRALVAWQHCLAADGKRVAAMDAIRDIHVERGAFTRAWEMLQAEQAAGTTPPAELGDKFLELGKRLLQEPLHTDICRAALQQASELLPDDEPARKALAELDANLADPEAHVRRLRVEAVEAPDKARAVSLYRQIAEIYYLQGNHDREVEENLAKCNLLSPGDLRVLEFMEKYYLQSRRSKELLERLEQIISRLADPRVTVPLLERVAMHSLVHLQDRKAANNAYRRILEIDPGHAAALASLIEAHQEEGRWADVVELMRAQAERMPLASDRAALLLEVARITSEHLRDPQGAHFLYEEVLRLDSNNVPAATALAKWYEKAGQWPELVRCLEIIIANTSDDKEKLKLLERLAEVHAGPLQDKVEAFHVRTRALALEPGRKKLLKEVVELGEQSGRYQELVQALQQAAGSGRLKGKALVEVLSQIATIQEQRLNRPHEAIVTWQRVLEVEPQSLAALDALERLQAAAGGSVELVDIYRRQLELVRSATKKRDLLLKLAAIYSERMADYQRAVAALQEAVELDAEDAAAWEQLADLHEREGRWEDAAHAWSRVLALGADAGQRNRQRLRLAGIYEQRLNDSERALELCSEILAEGEVEAEVASGAVAILERLQGRGVSALRIAGILQPYYALAGDWRRYVDMLELRLEACDTNEERLSLLDQIARVYQDHLQQPELALKAWSRAFRLSPGDDKIYGKVVELAEQTGRLEDLASLLEQVQREVGSDSEVGLVLAERLGQLYARRLNRPQQAIRCLRQLLEARRGDANTLEMLAELYRQVGNWVELAGVLETLVESERDDERRRQRMLELAELMENHVHDRPAAIAWLERVRQEFGEDLPLLQRLDTLLEAAGYWPQLAEVLQREIELADAEQVAELKLRLGTVQAERMEEGQHAVEYYHQVLAEKPDDERAIAGLEALLGQPEAAAAAAAILEPVFERRKEWAKLVRVLEVGAERGERLDEKLRYLIRAAELYEKRLEQPEQAFGALRRALVLQPGERKVREALSRLAERLAAPAELAAALEDAVGSTEDAAGRVPILQELAVLYRDKLRRPELAAASLRRLLEVEPENSAALASLENLYRESKSLQELAWVLQRQAELTQDQDKRRERLVQVAQILEEQLGDLEGAVTIYQQIFEQHPQDLQAAKQLDRLYRETGRWQEEARLLPQLARLSKNVLSVIDYLSRLAEINIQQLDEPRAAVQILQQVLQAKPNHPQTVERLEQLLRDERSRLAAAEVLEGVYRATSEWRKLAAVLEMQLAASADSEKRLQLLAQLRELYEERMGEQALAFNVAARAFKEQPQDEGVRQDLLRLAEQARLQEELVGIILDVADRHAGSELGLALRKQAAHLLERVLGRRREAVQLWRQLWESHGADQEVLAALERIYREEGDFEALVDVYRAQFEQSRDTEHRKDLLFRIAACLSEGVEDVAGAIATYEQILALDERDLRALKLLAGLLESNERWTELVAVLDRQIAVLGVPGDEQQRRQLGQLLLHKAQTCLERLDDATTAVVSVRQALELGVPAEAALELLERGLTREQQRQQVAELLEQIYRQQNDFKKLVAILEVQLQGRQEAEQRQRLYRELMQIYEQQLGQKPLAFTVACRAFREFFSDAGIRADLERLAEQTGSLEELAGVYEEVVEQARASEAGPDIERRLAQLKESYLQDKDEAVAHWRHVLASNPDDLEALRALERLYRERGLHAELVGVLRHLATLEQDADKRKDLYHEVATLMEERLGRDDGAIEAYREILALDPGDLAVLRLLDRLLQRQERWEELDEVLRAQARLVAASELPELQLRRAQLAWQHLGDAARAVELYQQVLQQDPGNHEALANLLKMFESVELRHLVVEVLVEPLLQAGDWKNLVAVLDARARLAQDPQVKKAAWQKMAELYEKQLGQKELALTILGRAFAVDPGDEQVRLALERLAAETDSFEMLSAVYEQGLELVEDRAVRMVLHRRLAGLYLQRLREPQQALEHLEAIADLAPGDENTLQALEEYYRAKNQHELLVKVLRRRIRATQDQDLAVKLLFEIGRLHEQQLQDLGGAIQAYRQVLEMRPDSLDALYQLDRLCAQQGRSKELAEVLQAEATALEQAGRQAEALDTWLRLARLVEQEFKDGQRAAELVQRILEQEPGHAGCVEYLEEVLVEERQLEGLTLLLEKAYEGRGDWQKYIDILETQVRQSRVMARRLELLGKIAAIQEHKLGLKALAFNTTVRRFHEDLTNAEVRAELERLAVADDNLEALAAVYEEELDNIEEPEVGRDIALKVAGIHRHELQDPEEAIRFYRAALRFDSRCREALDALDEIYTEQQDYENLAEILGRKIDLAQEPDRQVDTLYRLGRLVYEQQEDAGKAVGYFRKVLELQPDHLESLRLLERIFAELGELESLYEVLQNRLQYTTAPGERVELIARLGDLAADQLGRPQEAIELWQEVAQQEEYAEDAYEALDRLFEKTERWADLAALIEQRMAHTSDPEKVAVLSGRLGWVKGEKLGELEDAKRHYQEVLRLDPKDVNALQSLRTIYASAGEWEDLLGVLRRLVQLQDDMMGVKQIRFELAEVLGGKLQRRSEAIEAAKRAADIEPHSAADLERLARIFSANEAWQDAVQVLEQAVEQKDSDADKIEALLEIASIWRDKIKRPLGAAPVYEKILQLDPFHDNAFRAAETIYRENKEWRRLTGLLEGRLANIRERRDRVELIKEIAGIYEEKLAQKELAFARYCAAFREDFSDDEVLAKLERLAEETGDYDTLLEVLEDATEEVTSGPRAVRLLRKIAAIHHLRLGDPEKAEQQLRRAAELDPREVEALDTLGEMLAEQQRYEDYLAVLERKYERSDELEQRKEIRRQIAQVQEEKLERPDLAVESYRRILELDGRDGSAIQSLIRLLQQQQRWEELVQVLHRAAEQAEDRQVTTNHLFNIASLWETELDNDEEAISAYQAVLEVDEGHLESLRALERIYTRLDRWSELLEVFERQVDLVQQAEEKIRLYNKMGSIWEERFANLENAEACHEQILELDPENLASIKALERLNRRTGNFEKLIELYHRHLELVQERGEKVDIYLAIGEVWYRELSRVDKAEEVFIKALEVDGQSRPAIHALGQLYEKSGNWFNAIEMLQKEAELCGASPEAVDLYYRMGKINEDMLLDSAAAREAYTKALAIDPTYLPAIKALKLIHYLDKDFDGYLQMMVQEAEHTEDVEEKTRLFYEIGKFYQEHYEDSQRAAGYYEQALQLTSDFLPAAKPLADIYFRTEQWEQAEAMMEVVVQGLDRNTEARELCRQYYRLGYITEKLGKSERALEHYRQSYELDATYLPALEGLGNALIKAEQWEEAYRIYQTILIHHRDSLADAEVAELYWQIGDINFQMGELERSIGSFKKALEIDDTHLASLQYLVNIYQQQESWEEAYDFSLKMVEALEDDDLFEHYLRLGDMCREKLDDAFRAVDAYQGALRLREDSLEVLGRLLDVYVETRQFQKAVDILERITRVEGRPRQLVEYHLQAARLLRDELHNSMAAVEHFNAALDLDPSQVSAFKEIVEILRERRDWQELKANYIRMIKRLPIEARRVKLALWRDLGELCRVVLRNLNESIDAYRMIVSLEPTDVEALAILGDLLAARSSTLEEAIATHHKVLRMAADRVDSYRTLWKLYNQRKEYDKVYVLASILRYLKKADDEERKIFNYFSRKAPEVASRPINDRIWEKALAHPDVKVPFTRIFALLYRKAPDMFLKDHKELNLKKQNAVDLARDRSLFAHNFRIAAKVLGGVDVQLFARKDDQAPQAPGLVIVPTRPTAMIAYKEMFREDRKKHLLFQIGRQLAASRPQFILAYALTVKDLEILLQAACWLVEPDYNPTLEHRLVEPVRSRLRRALTESGRGMLKRAIDEYLSNARQYNLRRWVEAVEHSINRAGFVVCNDLATTLGILRKESAWLTPMRSIQKVREMLVFAASPEYLELRQLLGLAVSA